MSYVNPENSSQEIKLSSQFTRFFLDSIHSITSTTKLSEFVDLIKFKAKLRSNYINLNDVQYFEDKIRTCYLSFEESKVVKNDIEQYSGNNGLNIAKDDEFLNFIEDEIQDINHVKQIEEETSNIGYKIPLTYEEVIRIIEATVVNFAGSFDEMVE